MNFEHVPVLLNECLNALHIKPNGVYVDCTMGGGGHSYEIAKRLTSGRLIAIDQDSDAIAFASQKLLEFDDRVLIVKDNFKNLKEILNRTGYPKVDGILMDLGVSSFQLDNGERGFSYQLDYPLDMRMDQYQMLDAKQVVNTYETQRLAEIFRDYGEERYAHQIAVAILKQREQKPIETTQELVDISKRAMPSKALKEKGHPAKRVFQAIRMEVNHELDVLSSVLNDAFECLNSSGVLCIITFHSLEDRIVKHFFQSLAQGCTCPKSFPICVCNNKPKITYVNKKAIVAGEQELQNNHRAKSAKLRAAMKI